MLPPGVHFFHYSIKGSSGLSPQSAFFHTFSPKEILVRRWNGRSAAFEKVDQLTEENVKMEENLRNLDTNFGPYPFETYKKWCGLSSNLNSADIGCLKFSSY